MIERPRWMGLWYDAAKSVLHLAGSIFFRVQYSGQENIPPTGGLIIAANHQSTLDPPLIGIGVPRRLNFLARKTLYRFSPFGMLIRSLDAIPLDQEGSPLAGLREALRRVREGEGTLIFPEGSRSWDGKIAPFQGGFTVLARRSNATIVPAAIEGAWDAWPRWEWFPRTGNVHVHYGAAMPPDEVHRLRGDALVREVERRVREIHAELCRRPVFARRTHRRKPPNPLPPD
ncbi:MAG: 1-acyl-sn-glycerol-3-phosphate acyltransferase [Thermoguttaceae bacterium]|nr:1-acyl-sn-glycerol-3-phosphate acyltransferase [Thermoguttaceae bacterium]